MNARGLGSCGSPSAGAAGERPWRADGPLYALWGAGALLAAALFGVLALRVDPARKVIHGVDGVGYTLWVRSLVGDGDLDFADEIDRVHPGELPARTSAPRPVCARTSTA
jgi:hypothetical protein